MFKVYLYCTKYNKINIRHSDTPTHDVALNYFYPKQQLFSFFVYMYFTALLRVVIHFHNLTLCQVKNIALYCVLAVT